MRAILLLLAIVSQPMGVGDNYGIQEDYTGGAVTSSEATSSGTCSSADSVMYDNSGVIGCPRLTNVAPEGVMARPQPAFPGGSQAAANLVLCGGMDEVTVVIDSFAACGAPDSVTVRRIDKDGTSTNTALVFGTDWCASGCTDEATACASLATAVSALSHVSATCSSATVRVVPDSTACLVGMAESDATCTTAGIGTIGKVTVRGKFSMIDATVNEIFSINDVADTVRVTGSGVIRMDDDRSIDWGNSNDARCRYSTAQTPDSWICGVSTDSRRLLLIEAADINVDFAAAQVSNPTLSIQSADSASTTERLNLFHDGTNGKITVDSGKLILDSASTTAFNDNVTFDGTITGSSTISIGWNPVVASSVSCDDACNTPCVIGLDDGNGSGAGWASFVTCATMIPTGTCLCAGAN